LQQEFQNGALLPPQAIFQVDLIDLIRLTAPQAKVGFEPSHISTMQSSQTVQRSSGASLAHPQTMATAHNSNQINSSFRDPSMPLILRLDPKQINFLQEALGHSSFSQSPTAALQPSRSISSQEERVLSVNAALPSSGYSEDPALSSSRRIAAVVENKRLPRSPAGAASKSMEGMNIVQDGGSRSVGRLPTRPQFLRDVSGYAGVGSSPSQVHEAAAVSLAHKTAPPDNSSGALGSAARYDQSFGTPRLNHTGFSTQSSNQDGKHVLSSNYTPMSYESRSITTSAESGATPRSATPTNTHQSRFVGDADHRAPDNVMSDEARHVAFGVLRSLSTAAGTGRTSSLLSSQSLVVDDIDAKRKILAEVRCLCNLSFQHLSTSRSSVVISTVSSLLFQVRHKIVQKQAERRKQQRPEESTR
jgi:hypothetical protein